MAKITGDVPHWQVRFADLRQPFPTYAWMIGLIELANRGDQRDVAASNSIGADMHAWHSCGHRE